MKLTASDFRGDEVVSKRRQQIGLFLILSRDIKRHNFIVGVNRPLRMKLIASDFRGDEVVSKRFGPRGRLLKSFSSFEVLLHQNNQVARFFLLPKCTKPKWKNIPKWKKLYQNGNKKYRITIKFTKMTIKIQNGHEIT
jgi:hypothetical protein